MLKRLPIYLSESTGNFLENVNEEIPYVRSDLNNVRISLYL